MRVSTGGQAEEGVSLAAQEAKVRQWTELNDHEILSVHVDAGISGSGMKQPSSPLSKTPLNGCWKEITATF